jgi:hypothetical protein
MSHWALRAIDEDGAYVFINKRGGKTRDINKARKFSSCFMPHGYGIPWQWVTVDCIYDCKVCGVL